MLCVYETVSLYERIAAHTTDFSVYLFKRGEPYVAFSWVEKSKSGFNLFPHSPCLLATSLAPALSLSTEHR